MCDCCDETKLSGADLEQVAGGTTADSGNDMVACSECGAPYPTELISSDGICPLCYGAREHAREFDPSQLIWSKG